MARKYGWKAEATIGENTLDAIKYWGQLYGGQYPFEIEAKLTVYDTKSVASNEAVPELGDEPLQGLPISTVPCDDRLLYYLYGGSGAVNTVGTQKPRFSLFSESGTRKKEAFGCILHDLQWHYKDGEGVYATGVATGQSWQVSSATPTIGWYRYRITVDVMHRYVEWHDNW